LGGYLTHHETNATQRNTTVPLRLEVCGPEACGIDAKLVVVGMVANEFSIADPNDAGMMDVVGFDTTAPQLISDFASGSL